MPEVEHDNILPSVQYLICGTENSTRYIDISKLANSLGDDVCQDLIGLHAFTSYDRVSAFAGRGKLAAQNLLRINEKHQEAFKQLGESWDVFRELSENHGTLVCQMYASSSTTHKINELRHNLLCGKRGEVEAIELLQRLPPCTPPDR